MFKKFMVLLAGCSAFYGGVAHAQQMYVGGGASFVTFSDDFVDDDASLTALHLRLGAHVNDYFSAEARASVGVDDDSIDIMGIDADVELDHMFGVYVRGGIPVTPSVFPYAVLGYTRAKATLSALGESDSESESDVSFGAGVDLLVGSRLTVNVEYMNYYDKDDTEIDGISIGLATTF